MTHKIRFEPYNFKSTTIENIPVYYNHFDFASCIHIRILLRYGSMHDEAGKEGTSHFLEHVLFDGSSIFENEKATNLFSKTYTFETLNAHTGFFELVLKAKCLPENLKTVCEGMFSMVHSPTLTSESIEHERKIIIQEAWGRFKNEKYIAYSKKRQENRLYEIPDRIRMISPLGWPSTIEAISTEDIQSAHRKYFVKENIELYLAGNIEDAGGIEGIVRICSELFKKIPTGEKSKKPYIPTLSLIHI